MCLTVFDETASSYKRNELMRPKVAGRNIDVYKVLLKLREEPLKFLRSIGKPTRCIYQTPFYREDVRFRFWKAKMESMFGLGGTADFSGAFFYMNNISKNWWLCDGKVQFSDNESYVCPGFSAKDIENEGLVPKRFYVNNGIHAFVDVPSDKFFAEWFKLSEGYQSLEGAELVVFKATIPKGTEYYVGKDGDIVAEKMIVHKKKVKRVKKEDVL